MQATLPRAQVVIDEGTPSDSARLLPSISPTPSPDCRATVGNVDGGDHVNVGGVLNIYSTEKNCQPLIPLHNELMSNVRVKTDRSKPLAEIIPPS